jgi:hypothetical protein
MLAIVLDRRVVSHRGQVKFPDLGCSRTAIHGLTFCDVFAIVPDRGFVPHRSQVEFPGFGCSRTAIHGLTFHNGRFARMLVHFAIHRGIRHRAADVVQWLPEAGVPRTSRLRNTLRTWFG